MKSLVRARKYPDTEIGALLYLGGVIKYLEWEKKSNLDIFRLMAMCEAECIIFDAQHAIESEIEKRKSVPVFRLT